MAPGDVAASASNHSSSNASPAPRLIPLISTDDAELDSGAPAFTAGSGAGTTPGAAVALGMLGQLSAGQLGAGFAPAGTTPLAAQQPHHPHSIAGLPPQPSAHGTILQNNAGAPPQQQHYAPATSCNGSRGFNFTPMSFAKPILSFGGHNPQNF